MSSPGAEISRDPSGQTPTDTAVVSDQGESMGHGGHEALKKQSSISSKLRPTTTDSSDPQEDQLSRSRKRAKKDCESACKKACQWSEETHRTFVSAIFELGMLHASPTSVQQYMLTKSDELTSEKIKSHLQKFRKKEQKSVDEFMSTYNKMLAELKTLTNQSVDSVVGSGAEQGNTSAALPVLSEEEMNAPLGVSLAFLKGLYFSLHSELLQQRGTP